LRASSDATVLLGNGCVCCAVRTDLQESLRALFADRARGAVPSFERVVIETSGLADPGPVLQTFASDRALGEEFHLQALITVVDAPGGAGNLAAVPEARQQVALADRIVLSKTDRVDPAMIAALTGQIGALTAAPIATAAYGVIAPGYLLDEGRDLPALSLPPVAPAQAGVQGSNRTPGSLDSRFRGNDEEFLEHDHAHAHSHGIDSFALFFESALPWPVFEQAMAVLTALRGPDLLRVKGLVAVEGVRGPVVVQAVQHVAHRPVELEDWPDSDRRSRLVFITRNLGRPEVEQLFAAVAGLGTVNEMLTTGA
jgi:G3E family GTPase